MNTDKIIAGLTSSRTAVNDEATAAGAALMDKKGDAASKVAASKALLALGKITDALDKAEARIIKAAAVRVKKSKKKKAAAAAA